MYGDDVRERAAELRSAGLSVAAIHRTLGVSRAAIAHWQASPVPTRHVSARCFVCRHETCADADTYAYLLGQYLGDGYLVTAARVPKLRIACADAYPGIAGEVDHAMTTLSGNRVCVTHGVGCSDHASYWTHWPCLLPQHGPGRKHERPIVLTDWQRAIVDEHPWPLVRGLIHSDGCRVINRLVVNGKVYAYPRYLFSNESADIQAVLTRALDQVGVPWRTNRPNIVSIARRAGVAFLDRHIDPKRSWQGDGMDELDAHARALIDANLYVTLGTADVDGTPWVSPVYFATADYAEFYWVSRTDAVHSRNIAQRPQLSMVIFDSKLPTYSGRAVYLSGEATELSGPDLDRGVEIYPGAPARGASTVALADVTPPAPYRLYRATVTGADVLCPREPGQPCAVHGIAMDHRAPVTPWRDVP